MSPSAEQEAAHLNLTIGVVEKLVTMGMPANEFHAVGAALIRGRNSSKSPIQLTDLTLSDQIQEITLVQNTVTGAPLILEFEKIFLRPAVLPESDITFTTQELSTWAARIW